MTEMDFVEKLEECEDLPDIFELVKESVKQTLGRDRAGLMLGLADLGNFSSGFVGAYYPVDTNIIVMNRNPLERIKESKPELFKPYAFHILLHEYLHTLGLLSEERVRHLTYMISKECFGEEHLVSQIARDISKIIPNIVYPGMEWKPNEDFHITLVEGFDRSSYPYIG